MSATTTAMIMNHSVALNLKDGKPRLRGLLRGSGLRRMRSLNLCLGLVFVSVVPCCGEFLRSRVHICLAWLLCFLEIAKTLLLVMIPTFQLGDKYFASQFFLRANHRKYGANRA